MDKHYGFIYLTIDLKNGKGYIGQHKICNQKTLDPQYIGSGRIIRDILKGNVNNKSRFHRQILCLCENQEELDEMEIYYIDYFDAIESENFYNCAEGGKGGNKFANKTVDEMEEYKKNMSIVQRKRYKNKEARKKQSKAQKKRYEDEKEREKTSLASKKQFQDPEARKKASIAQRKRWEDKEKRKKQSETMKKRYEDPEERKKTSITVKKRFEDPEARKKCGRPGEKSCHARSVYCKELNIIFSYVKLAEKYCVNILNSKIRQIGNVCDGKRKSTGKLTDGTKLTWSWAEDVDQETLKNATYIDSKKYEEILSQNVNDCK